MAVSLPKEDLELIDALVLVGAISRGGARELVSCDVQPGRVATRIMELGLCNLAGGGYVVVDRLAKYEATQRHVRVVEDVGPYNPRVHGQCSCGGSRNAYLSCEVHAEPPETD
jgi:hypothetical protein